MARLACAPTARENVCERASEHASEHEKSSVSLPPAGFAQRWAYDYVTSEKLSDKLTPAAAPCDVTDFANDLPALRLLAPGRPVELRVSTEKGKTPRAGALGDPRKRAELLHTFLHHELQAAELMCWALLAFPETPVSFQARLARDLPRRDPAHAHATPSTSSTSAAQSATLPVRDWFWSRVPSAASPTAFCSVMGLGFEAGNLDHTQRFAQRFRAVGDERGARAAGASSAHEEIAHVAFAAHWFRVFEGELSFARLCEALPAPLSPMVMRGDPIDRDARSRAGMDETFLDELTRWQPVSRGS